MMPLILLMLTFLFSTSVLASEHCILSPKETLNFLMMDYQTFDQTPHNGSRKLYAKGCYLDTALLIDSWHLNHLGNLKLFEASVLYFHAGQSYAREGAEFYLIAINHFKSAVLTDKATMNENAYWNHFVKGTIAFFNQDKAELIKNLKILQKMPRREETINSTKALQELLIHFGKPY